MVLLHLWNIFYHYVFKYFPVPPSLFSSKTLVSFRFGDLHCPTGQWNSLWFCWIFKLLLRSNWHTTTKCTYLKNIIWYVLIYDQDSSTINIRNIECCLVCVICQFNQVSANNTTSIFPCIQGTIHILSRVFGKCNSSLENPPSESPWDGFSPYLQENHTDPAFCHLIHLIF